MPQIYLPHQDLIDYSKFTIVIADTEFDRVEEVLLQYSDEELLLMQAYMLKLQQAMLYDPQDINAQDLWNPNSPMFFINIELGMKYERHK